MVSGVGRAQLGVTTGNDERDDRGEKGGPR